MARTEDDTWDLANSVGATATMVAAARAAATRRPQPVITDQFAEPLVRAVGLDVFTKVAGGEMDFEDFERGLGFPRVTDTFAARARYYDDYFAEACVSGTAGIRQVVIVAAGLDSRAYRLSWPTGTTVYEIDQPEVIEFKTSTLSGLGAEYRPVGIDLRDDWPAALRGAGFEVSEPTAWLAEGVLIGFLPPEAEVRLLDNVIALSAVGSRFSADYGSLNPGTPEAGEQAQLMADGWRAQGLELDISGLTYPGEHTDVAAHLESRGWQVTRCGLPDLFDAAGLPRLDEADRQSAAATIRFVRAEKT
ncbi:SAM-dependent methyltransferase [Mycobacterium sp. 1164966.3]|uniref:class I SAM-dependent methyltransferase n=1 Tax=Mycobacterium sp. 1164966.3 TaxID=1856861 RepID=UPI0007FC78D4|nr:class I SAM-dependent methyltransferase [Mycobacterium sp. 1164966.3]OBA83650.1 SAM-dependent methyltransferase [Mycobacterium sp. 1164966.3]